jgi:hypothetical protein
MTEPVPMIGTEAEYNESCMGTSHMHMTLNHIEEVEDEPKEDKPVDIYIYNRSAVDMGITFKDIDNTMHIRCRFNFVKQGVHD